MAYWDNTDIQRAAKNPRKSQQEAGVPRKDANPTQKGPSWDVDWGLIAVRQKR